MEAEGVISCRCRRVFSCNLNPNLSNKGNLNLNRLRFPSHPHSLRRLRLRVVQEEVILVSCQTKPKPKSKTKTKRKTKTQIYLEYVVAFGPLFIAWVFMGVNSWKMTFDPPKLITSGSGLSLVESMSMSMCSCCCCNCNCNCSNNKNKANDDLPPLVSFFLVTFTIGAFLAAFIPDLRAADKKALEEESEDSGDFIKEREGKTKNLLTTSSNLGIADDILSAPKHLVCISRDEIASV